MEKQEESQTQGTYIGNQPKEDYNFDQIKMLWRRFAFEMKERGMETFYNAMIKREPIREENDKFKMLLDNQIQHDYITTHLQDMNDYFRKELKNYNVQISLEINDKPEEETKYLTGKDKFQALDRKNPNLHTLKNMFNLDVEY